MKYRVKNWAEFQHYKDRNPTWIKLHKSLLDDYEFQCLPVASRALAPMLWLLASEEKTGEIDGDLRKIAFRLRMTEKEVQEAINPLVTGGFLQCSDFDSTPLAEPERESSPETETETQVTTKTETPLNPPTGGRKLTFAQSVESTPDLKTECITKAKRLFAEHGWPEINFDLVWEEFERYWAGDGARKKKIDWPGTFYNRAMECRVRAAYRVDFTADDAAKRIAAKYDAAAKAEKSEMPAIPGFLRRTA